MIKNWHKNVLRLAGYYNLLYGAWILLFPFAFFRLTGLPDPLYPVIWQSVGMIVGVYGIGYLIAATDPMRHWPIILVGLAGKIFGPLGFVFYALQGQIPWAFGLNILTNDIIWLVPFTIILLTVFRQSQLPENSRKDLKPWPEMLLQYRTFKDHNPGTMQKQTPVMFIFLRHFGCVFCKEALTRLGKSYQAIESKVPIIIVHMSACERAEAYLRQFQLNNLDHISDPDGRLYEAFQLKRGSFGAMFGWKELFGGVKALLFNGNGVGALEGDGFRLGGIFMVFQDKLVDSFRSSRASDVLPVETMIEKNREYLQDQHSMFV